MRERISGEFSPTPPVKTRTSMPPIAAAIEAIDPAQPVQVDVPAEYSARVGRGGAG